MVFNFGSFHNSISFKSNFSSTLSSVTPAALLTAALGVWGVSRQVCPLMQLFYISSTRNYQALSGEYFKRVNFYWKWQHFHSL